LREINQTSVKNDPQRCFRKEGTHIYVDRSLTTHDERCLKPMWQSLADEGIPTRAVTRASDHDLTTTGRP
jgi:hypothetical protein